MIDFPIYYEFHKIMVHALFFSNNTGLLFCAKCVMEASQQALL